LKRILKISARAWVLVWVLYSVLLPQHPARAEVFPYKGPQPRFVFLFIGDGMGLAQRAAAESYLAAIQGRDLEQVRLEMNRFPNQALTTTRAVDRFIGGSAAAATALATGFNTRIGYLALDPDHKPRATIAEMARDQGLKVGIVSTVSLDHATPAAFYAHESSRGMYHEIGHDLVQSRFDFLAGGGFLDPAGVRSSNPRGDVRDAARQAGYAIVRDKKSFTGLRPGRGRVIAMNHRLTERGAIPYLIDRTSDDLSLAEFTRKGIELLENPKGFFMMIEGGKIDWACHANDARTAIDEVLDFDLAVKVAVRFMEKHPHDTLIVVTGDHETGGMSLGSASTRTQTRFEILQGQAVSFKAFEEDVRGFRRMGTSFEDAMQLVRQRFGLDGFDLSETDRAELREAFQKSMDGEKHHSNGPDYLRYGECEPFCAMAVRVLNHQAGIGWTSYNHTGIPVVTSALGTGAGLFNGYYPNKDVAWKIMSIMGLKKASRPAR